MTARTVINFGDCCVVWSLTKHSGKNQPWHHFTDDLNLSNQVCYPAVTLSSRPSQVSLELLQWGEGGRIPETILVPRVP